MGQNFPGEIVTRLRAEGRAVVMTIPQNVREELGWKSGDLLIVRAREGKMIGVRVDLRDALQQIEQIPTESEGKA